MDDAQLLKLAAELGAALQQKGWKLALAESCTGGMAAQTVTAITGSSAWFERGFVTYSNAAKIEMLDVSAATLAQQGAVSEQTAREMVLGALKHSHADIAVAITGIAGPDGGSADKPVGTVCFAWATSQNTVSETVRLPGSREQVRKKAVVQALQGLSQLTLDTDL
jgi:nicotinamide-nucleotide amidase